VPGRQPLVDRRPGAGGRSRPARPPARPRDPRRPNSLNGRNEIAYVSTGALPPAEQVAEVVQEAYERYRDDAGGEVAGLYPALARVDPDLFGVSVVGTSGAAYAAGDGDVAFSMMSVAKPFDLALVCEERGPEEVRELVGVNATGLAFNSPEAIVRSEDGRTNPMVNPGALATTSLAPSWEWIRAGLSAFAGRELSLDDEVFESVSATNYRNRELAGLLIQRGRLQGDPERALDLYTRQSSLSVSARDLAAMGATLANGGVNPLTGARIVGEAACRLTLAAMATAGLYETSGDWLCDVGLPGKSGLSGGMVTVSPGKGALGTFAPRVDSAGNSVKGQLVARYLSRRLGLDLFVSAP
jgi:glutaminase